MKISKNLKIKNSEPILLIVAGKQEASFYKISGEKLDLISTCKVKKPKYSDNEGHFKVRSSGQVIRSGSIRELDDKIVINDFLKKFKDHINKNIKSVKYGSIYIAMPAYMKNILLESLPITTKELVKKKISGNFLNETPLDVLKKFMKSGGKKKAIKILIAKKEVRKILKKSKNARKIIKGK